MIGKISCSLLILISLSVFANSDATDLSLLAEDTTQFDSLLKEDTSISLDSIETVGDFSVIESGEEQLFQEEIFGGEGDSVGRKTEGDLSGDFSDSFDRQSSFLATSDALQVDHSFLGQLEDPLKSSGDPLGSGGEWGGEFKRDFNEDF